MKITEIAKSYSESVSLPDSNGRLCTYKFFTSVKAQVEVEEGQGEKLVEESDKLFKAAKDLTLMDIENTKERINQ